MVAKYNDAGNASELVDCDNAQNIGGAKTFNDAPIFSTVAPGQLLSTDGGYTINNPSWIFINGTSTPGLGIGNLYVTKVEDGGTVMISIQNDANTAGSDGRFDIRIAGSDGGDAYVNMDISGVGGWSFGVDNSDNDKFKIDHGGPAMPGVNTCMSIDYTTGDIVDHQGNFSIATAGKTLIVAEGSNACKGSGATMVAGTVTVSTTAVNDGDIVLLMKTAAAGTSTVGMPVVTIVDGVSFDITGAATDTSTWSWMIIK